MSETEMVNISLREYIILKDRSDWLQCLQNAGVDNWQGIDYAHELKEEEGDGGV